MHKLNIKILDSCPNKDYVVDYYKNKSREIGYQGDAGVDLIFPEDTIFETNRVTKIGFGIACEFIPNGSDKYGSYLLTPRSSISNTPLQLANSIGIIDAGYRGEIIAKFRCFIDRDHEKTTILDHKYPVAKGERLVQIISPDLLPIQICLAEKLSETDRGSKGFGSTGK